MRRNIPVRDENQQKARLFFALWPAPALRRQLHSLALQTQAATGGRTMRAETLHMTLLFLGEVPLAQISQLEQAADTVEFEAFAFALEQLSCWRHNQILYAAPAQAVPPLQALAQRLRTAADLAGIDYDKRGFTPHVTLLRKVQHPPEQRALVLPLWQVQEFALVESQAAGPGVRYRNLRRWACRS